MCIGNDFGFRGLFTWQTLLLDYLGLSTDMALLDEQLVEEWLNRQNFFTIRGIKSGNDEIDLLAIRPTVSGLECWHVEVQVSYRPVGYVGGDTNARRRTASDLRAGVEQWIQKKFTSPKKVDRRNEVLPNAVWRPFFVHAVLKDETELVVMKELGIELISYRQILYDLCSEPKSRSSSSASSVVEMLKYLVDFPVKATDSK